MTDSTDTTMVTEASTIVLFATSDSVEQMKALAQKYQGLLSKYRLLVTKNLTTPLQPLLESTSLAAVCPNLDQGGDLIAAAEILTGSVAAVVVLSQPAAIAQTGFAILAALTRACYISDVPLALNEATAIAVLGSLRSARVAHLIFNPVSGQGNAQQDLLKIRQWLTPQLQLHVHLTTPDRSPQELAQAAIAAGAELILASGGDGTVSAVAGATINTDIPLGVIPRGTANAFAVALGIPTNLRGACDTILAGLTQTVDAARCNGQPLILLAGIGFEAETVERANRETKSRWGTLAYIFAGIQQLGEQELFDTTIEVDDASSEFKAAAITIANAAPPTSVLAQGSGKVIASDGLLDVTIGSPKNTLQAIDAMVSLFGSALTRAETEREDIVRFQAKTVNVTTDPPQKVVLDGEIIGTTPITVECLPGALKVFAPRQPE